VYIKKEKNNNKVVCDSDAGDHDTSGTVDYRIFAEGDNEADVMTAAVTCNVSETVARKNSAVSLDGFDWLPTCSGCLFVIIVVSINLA